LMYFGDWSCLGFVEDEDMLTVAYLLGVPEEEGNEEGDILMPDDWDTILVETN
ncbi:ectomycorrhizas secreted protein, partial [Armillaria mellea]